MDAGSPSRRISTRCCTGSTLGWWGCASGWTASTARWWCAPRSGTALSSVLWPRSSSRIALKPTRPVTPCRNYAAARRCPVIGFRQTNLPRAKQLLGDLTHELLHHCFEAREGTADGGACSLGPGRSKEEQD